MKIRTIFMPVRINGDDAIKFRSSNMMDMSTTVMIRKLTFCTPFYHNHVGCVRDTNWNFQLSDLYPEGPLQLDQLDAPLLLLRFKLPSVGCTPMPVQDLISLLCLTLSTITLLTLNESTAPFLSSSPRRTMHGLLRISGPSLSRTPPSNAFLKSSPTGFSP